MDTLQCATCQAPLEKETLLCAICDVSLDGVCAYCGMEELHAQDCKLVHLPGA